MCRLWRIAHSGTYDNNVRKSQSIFKTRGQMFSLGMIIREEKKPSPPILRNVVPFFHHLVVSSVDQGIRFWTPMTGIWGRMQEHNPGDLKISVIGVQASMSVLGRQPCPGAMVWRRKMKFSGSTSSMRSPVVYFDDRLLNSHSLSTTNYHSFFT